METIQFMVSCFNRTTDAVIYHDQLVDAIDSVQAKDKADKIHKKKLLRLPSDTVRRYVIEPVEGDKA